jgi:hypothetical protein
MLFIMMFGLLMLFNESMRLLTMALFLFFFPIIYILFASEVLR